MVNNMIKSSRSCAQSEAAQTVGLASARAHPNIALIKYWGKRDEYLMLPVAGSMSMTLDSVATTTTVQLGGETDRFFLGGELISGRAAAQVSKFLDLLRAKAASTTAATVISENQAPTAAGLASSASGFAALAVAGAGAYGLELNQRELSMLARRGSGSASRSVIDRFALWHAGESDETSYAEPIAAPDMRMIVCQISAEEKPVSSREAMRITRDSSPFWGGWAGATENALQKMRHACAAGDFSAIGRLTETHALQMHALIMSTEPPLRYLAPKSFEVFDRVKALRQDGLECYATADAGPNVVALARPGDAAAVAAELAPYGAVHIAAPGPGAHLLGTHLNEPV